MARDENGMRAKVSILRKVSAGSIATRATSSIGELVLPRNTLYQAGACIYCASQAGFLLFVRQEPTIAGETTA